MSTRSSARATARVSRAEASRHLGLLQRKLARARRDRERHRATFTARTQVARGRFFEQLGDIKPLLRTSDLALTQPRRVRPQLAILGDRLDPPLLAGSLNPLYFPPYTHESTSPVSTGPTVWTNASAKLGSMRTSLFVVKQGGSYEALAAIGISLLSKGIGHIEVRALVDFAANWELQSFGDLSCHCEGWIGLYVSDGTTTLIDQSESLWSRDLDSFWGDHVGDSVEGISALSCQFPVTYDRRYWMSVVCGVRADASGQTSPVSASGAKADLYRAQVPFMGTTFMGQVSIPPDIIYNTRRSREK